MSEQQNQKLCYELIKEKIIRKESLTLHLIKEIHKVLTSGTYDEQRYIKNEERLTKKFNKEKIIVLGYSWGSVLGTALVQTYPKAFSAYIGVGQVVDGAKGEKVGFEKVMDLAMAKIYLLICHFPIYLSF